jgi:DNA polymerase III subunit gamma/tau
MTDPTSPAASGSHVGAAYRVLARKYRPRSFAELIGQDALVRTLTNAIQSGRIAQAFMLTGVRGVGKTTTARIIARALNCIGPDGTGGPTVSPCGVCDNCRAIAEDRHVDVMEMDAASHTGVDDIRDIIDGVRYAPTSARYKLYIIDEVHMLSKNAFNALLKTLEEPPAHVKFVFATTEIRKVPVTVLSRCQRFDLRRVESGVLKAHFTRIAGLEGATLEPDAAALLARAADGSVRDGLSLLDQAIALAAGTVSALQVRDMLGLADRARIIDLFEATLSGRPAEALEILADLHRAGADPVVILQDLLDLTHELTRLKVVPNVGDDDAMPEAERSRGGALAGKLGMAALTRAWQILLKGLGEVQAAPAPHQALDMVIIRLSFAADLPTPGDLIRQIQNQGGGAGGPVSGGNGGGSGARLAATGGARLTATGGAPQAMFSAPAPRLVAPAPARAEAQPMRDAAVELSPIPADFPALVKLFVDRREGLVAGQLRAAAHLVRFEPGRLEFRPGPGAPPTLAGRVAKHLDEWTGRRWIVAVSDAPGAPTLAEQEQAAERAFNDAALAHPLTLAALEMFPKAKVEAIRDLSDVVPAAEPAAAEPAASTASSDDAEHYPTEDYPVEEYPLED